MNVDRYKTIASEIIALSEGMPPAEYEMALTLAVGIYFKAMFPHNLEDAFKSHLENLRAIMEELDKNRHRDDVLELHGVTM